MWKWHGVCRFDTLECNTQLKKRGGGGGVGRGGGKGEGGGRGVRGRKRGEGRGDILYALNKGSNSCPHKSTLTRN